MGNGIVSACIQAVGTIIAAIIGVGILERIIHKEIVPNLFSYSEPSHDLWKILRLAKKEVIIVVAYGDRLLQMYETHFLKLLRKEVEIKFLMLYPEDAVKMAINYMHVSSNNPPSVQDVSNEILNSLDILEKLHKKYGGNGLKIRQTHLPLSASYIAVDIPEDDYDVSNKVQFRESVIQMMVYQFGVRSKDAPIVYLAPKINEKQFGKASESIQNMWFQATPLNFQKTRLQLRQLTHMKKKLKASRRSSRRSASSPRHTVG